MSDNNLVVVMGATKNVQQQGMYVCMYVWMDVCAPSMQITERAKGKSGKVINFDVDLFMMPTFLVMVSYYECVVYN